MTAARIRREFIDFFVGRHAHVFVPGSPVVPHEDPTLLFTNAGMNQFKDVFLGHGDRPYRRAVNSQKCIRAGGKHNDLEDVGCDHYHHTFFEMLGNWSFGDYFKAEAIEWAWELLTGWGLDRKRLYVTVFEGNAAEGLEPDTEAQEIWTQYVDPSHISRWGKKDNFWEMGDSGPCGPCSEIHYDFTDDCSGRHLVNRGDPRVVEMWNLVFIQFNRGKDGTLAPLPAKHVDTGMGLERLTRVLQRKNSNYDIDLFAPIFRAIEAHTGAHPYRGTLEDPVDVAYRVIADHVRCLTAAITDGAWPSNEGRGFVLRRILRRAVRHAHQTLGVQGPLLCDLVPPVVETRGDAFPELAARPDRVADVIRDEEESFLRTLDRGLRLFSEALDRSRAAGAVRIAACDAFRLHDTYGFPIDLTRVMATEHGMDVDLEGYERLMEEARRISRGAARGEERLAVPPEALARLRHLGVPPTVDSHKYDPHPLDTEILAIWNGSDFDNAAHMGRHVALITGRTNHYAEAGGQVGDTGTIAADVFDLGALPGRGLSGIEPSGDGRFEVEDTEAFGGYVLHVGRVTDGQLRLRDRVTITVDRPRRAAIAANHTATHLLNFALREIVGPEEDQKGSLVAPDRLRFDFTCPHALGDEQILEAERIVNERIGWELPVYAAVMPLALARSITGVRAIFGEKYPDPVRVVSIGVPLSEITADPQSPHGRSASIELCGGTHLAETSQAGRFVIVSEQALASGVRRITAVTGPGALAADAAGRSLEERARRAERLSGEELGRELDEVSALVDELTMGAVARGRIKALLEPLRQRAKAARKAQQAESRAGAVEEARRIASAATGPVIVERLDAAGRDELLGAMDAIRARHAGAAVMLLGADAAASRVAIVARVPQALIDRGLKAGDWVRVAAEACGGRGGGRPDMAQAGGTDPGRIDDAIAAAKAHVQRFL